jgi:4-oxalocrotonate tautomerase
MPYVNIKVTPEGPEGVTQEQKAALVRGVSDLLETVLGKHPSRTFVVIDVVQTDDWGVGGELVSRLPARAQAATGSATDTQT